MGLTAEAIGRRPAGFMPLSLDRHAWAAVPALMSALFAFVWILREAVAKLDGMGASAWDLGDDQQVIWGVAHGQNFFSSFHHTNFLGIHFELIFIVPALVERVWPDPRVLLVFASLGLAATAPAAYLLLRAILPDTPRAVWLAAALAAPLPFWASIQQAARDDFHPENMALALALLAAWAGVRGRPRLMWALVAALLCCKEDQVYTAGVVGLVVATRAGPAKSRHGRWVIAASIAWLLIAIGVVQQLLIRQSGYSDFSYYARLFHGATVQGVINAVTAPAGWSAVAVMIASMAGLPLLRPRWLLLVLPPMLASLLSHHGPEVRLQLHYALLPMFPIIVAGALGGRRLLELAGPPRPALAAVALPALMLGFLLGSLPPGERADSVRYQVPDLAPELKRAANVIPEGAPVAADDGLTPWLAGRAQINGFPDPRQAREYVVVEVDPYEPDGVRRAQHRTALAELASGGRRLLYDDGRFQVWSPAM